MFQKFRAFDADENVIIFFMKRLNVSHGDFETLELIEAFFNSVLMKKIFQVHGNLNPVFGGKTSENVQSFSKVRSK